MPATVLPSDSISQAPRRHHHHHRRERSSNRHGSSRYSSDQPLLTEANLQAHTTEVAASKRSSQVHDRRSEEVIEEDVNEREEVATPKHSSSAHPTSAERSVAHSKASSSYHVAVKSARDTEQSSPSEGARMCSKEPNKWVIVEVDEYDDRIVEREYTIERVRRYHYGS